MFNTLDSFDTEYSADSVEWCPANAFQDIFVCGTYQLTKKDEQTSDRSTSSKRLGRIYAFRVADDGHLMLLQKLEVPAVLDMKWAHVAYRDKILLGVVNSLGCLQIYQLKSNDQKESLELLIEKRITDGDETLALSLDWCTGRWTRENESNPKIVVSDSKGFVSLLEINESELSKVDSWPAHEFEAWIAAFDCWDTNVIYTGGDDCKFYRFDTRVGATSTGVSKAHGAGVTSVHSNAAKEFLLSSGSYDETLRLWDTRHFKRPVSEVDLGGGIWRLKWDPFARKYLLAACMYGGFRIIDCENTESPSLIGEYNEHESIAYGCDWSLLSSPEIAERILKREMRDVALIGTCSFYDHTLRLSAIFLQNE